MSTPTPIDKSHTSLHLVIPPFQVHLAQYAPDVSIPPTLFQANLPFLSVTRSPGETTVLYGVCSSADSQAVEGEDVVAQFGLPQPRAQDGPYAVLRVRGPLNLTLTGILNELTMPLRTALVPIYAVSTWDTDYVLVPSSKLVTAKQALTEAGWTFGEVQ